MQRSSRTFAEWSVVPAFFFFFFLDSRPVKFTMELLITFVLLTLFCTVSPEDYIFDPTSRDYTYKCEVMARKAREGEQCAVGIYC